MPDVVTIPTQTISGPYTGPGLSHNAQLTNAVGNGGSGFLLNADTNPDELAALRPMALKESSDDPGVQFPGIMMRETQSKSLAIHMYPNLDSARVENMGRDPAIFNIRAIFTNHIYPGQNETWTPGLLFPNTFNVVYNILLSNNTIIFQHPVLGDITVQVHRWTYELNPKQARDGAFMDIELIETIGDQNPLAQQVAPPPGKALKQTAEDLDNAIADVDQSLSPPGLTLSQFFGQVANLVNQAVAFPNNVVNSVNEDIVLQVVTGVSSVGAAFAKAPATVANNTVQAIQNFKDAVSNTPIQNAVSYDQSTYTAMQSILHLNNTPSQNAFQLINKSMRAIWDLMQHYIDLNDPRVSPIIAALMAMLLQLQQVQSALSLNTNNQTVKVRTYVLQVPMTWMQLSRYLNNTLDDLMGLNQGLVNELWLAQGTTVNFFQA